MKNSIQQDPNTRLTQITAAIRKINHSRIDPQTRATLRKLETEKRTLTAHIAASNTAESGQAALALIVLLIAAIVLLSIAYGSVETALQAQGLSLGDILTIFPK